MFPRSALARTLLTQTLTQSTKTSLRPLDRLSPLQRQPLNKSNHINKAFTRNFSATMSGKEGVHNLQSKADFDKAMEEKGKLMVLDCMATWCGPCKVIAPQVVK